MEAAWKGEMVEFKTTCFEVSLCLLFSVGFVESDDVVRVQEEIAAAEDYSRKVRDNMRNFLFIQSIAENILRGDLKRSRETAPWRIIRPN